MLTQRRGSQGRGDDGKGEKKALRPRKGDAGLGRGLAQGEPGPLPVPGGEEVGRVGPGTDGFTS